MMWCAPQFKYNFSISRMSISVYIVEWRTV